MNKCLFRIFAILVILGCMLPPPPVNADTEKAGGVTQPGKICNKAWYSGTSVVGKISGITAGSGVATYCGGTACTGQSDADQGCDDYEMDSDGNCTWSTITSTGGTVSYANTPSSGMGCSEANTHNMKLSKTAAGALAISKALTAGGYFYLIGHIYFSSLTDGDSVGVINIAQNNGSGPLLTMYLTRSGSNYYVYSSHRNYAMSYVTGSNQAVSLEQWYPIKMIWRKNSTQAAIYIDLNNDGDFDDANETLLNSADVANLNAGYVYLGVNSYVSASRWAYEFDNLKISSTATPNFCTR